MAETRSYNVYEYTDNVPSVTVNGAFMSLDWFTDGPFGALELGLVFAAMTFGVVVTKAISYYRGNTYGGALVKTAVMGMLLLNIVQMIATIHGTYIALVIDFGRLDHFGSPGWGLTLQILFTTLTASIAQTFFACRLYAVMRNLFLTIFLLFLTVVQLALCIYAVTVLFDVTPAWSIMNGSGDLWSMIATFAISAVINIVIAIAAYVRLQRPYVLQKYGRTTFLSELEYWTVKSLFICSLVSILGAVTVSTKMIWVAASCVLGNLYTLSVILSSSDIPRDGHSDRASSAPLTHHQATKAASSPEYNDGSHVNDGAV